MKKYHKEHVENPTRAPQAKLAHIEACFRSAEARTKWDDLDNQTLSPLDAIGSLCQSFKKAKDREEEGVGCRRALKRQLEEISLDQTRTATVPNVCSGLSDSYFSAGIRDKKTDFAALAPNLELAVPESYQVAETIDSVRDVMQLKRKLIGSSESLDGVEDAANAECNTIGLPKQNNTKEQKLQVKRPRGDVADKLNFMENIRFRYRDANSQHMDRKRKLRHPRTKTHLKSPLNTESEYDGDTDSATGNDYMFKPPSKRAKRSYGSTISHYNEWTIIEGQIPSSLTRCVKRKRRVHFLDETEGFQQRRKLEESSGISGVMKALSESSLGPSSQEGKKHGVRCSLSPPLDRCDTDSSGHSRWNRIRKQRPSIILTAPLLVAHQCCKTCVTGPYGSRPEKKVFHSMGTQSGAKEDEQASSSRVLLESVTAPQHDSTIDVKGCHNEQWGCNVHRKI